MTSVHTSEKPRVSIVVVGSVNMDLVAKMVRLPAPGETVSGESFQMIPGGKGANQAVAAARLGTHVAMIARVGDDSFGGLMRQNLAADGIDTTHVLATSDCSSGVALIGVDASGANQIIVVPGANGRLSVADVRACESTIASAQALVVQLETPLATVAEAIRIARQHGVLTILDPAPAPDRPLPPELMSVDLISPNQSEAKTLTGSRVDDFDSAQAAARRLHLQGARDVILKMGELGALVSSHDGLFHRVTACKADVVDTTAAGDAFTAALAVALCEGQSLVCATEFATLAGTFACTRFGAQPAMPTRRDLDELSGKILPN
jgi:ribokinase